LSTTAKYLRRKKIAAAGSGLGTTINYLRGAASIGLGTTAKYLRRATSAVAGNDLGSTPYYLRCTTSGAAGNGFGTTIKYLGAQRKAPRALSVRNYQVPAAHKERRRGLRPGKNDQVAARRRGHRPL
jgi:predicted TIM-barrel enzyme